ncbi:grasp-with-spasm system SPASM domain peptide maturase [Mucilaginibacter sp.]|uniref:grasp-with-spasm system SPASM domain peptide maturase n=1 Tax=Mucilaginibacter sp. TaxID=1882438 RepID=UPI00260E30BC|nr:grasp-with-spasm system SPASM domain peptide maturase [Mucilaginibacter sp.]MDB4926573.1 hypothetical protein [Mucilaginibacter sp.]
MEQAITNTTQFVLFSCCIPVKGASRSLIVDMQRENMYFISNELYDLIRTFKEKSYLDVVSEFDEDSIKNIDEYLDFLSGNQLGFWTNEAERFPDISMEWDHPSIITNAIIDSRISSRHDWPSIFAQLEALGCQDIQLRFYDTIAPDELVAIVKLTENTRIKSLEFIIKYNAEYSKRLLKSIVFDWYRIKTITLHSAPYTEVYILRPKENRSGMGNVLFTKQAIDSNQHCGIISEKYFTLNGIRSVSEAKQFNSCLNRKISIDHDGSIKNCPTLPTTYGNITETTLASVIDDRFKEVWFINKDQINICQICEFRYICTDCRAFVDNKFDKPKKCNYDPHTMVWSN